MFDSGQFFVVFSMNLWQKINNEGNTNKILTTEINAQRANKITNDLIKSILATKLTPIHVAKNENPLVIMETLDFSIAIKE